MDAEYLKQNVGGALAKGLAACAAAQPVDPVEYLGLWLINYVQTQRRDAQLKKEDEQLEEERRKYLQNLEYERLKAEEEKRVAEEKAKKLEEQKEQERLEKLSFFEQRKGEVQAEIEKNEQGSDLLFAERKYFTLMKEMLQSLKPQEISQLIAVEPPTDTQLVLKAVLLLLGFLPLDWQKIARKYTQNDIQAAMIEYLPTTPQPIRNFQYTEATIQKLPAEFLNQKLPFVVVIFYEWVKAALEMRKAALKLKYQSLGIEGKPQPPVDPDTIDEENEDEEEQDDLEQYTTATSNDQSKDEEDDEEEGEETTDFEEGD